MSYREAAANYATTHGKKLPKGKIAFYTALYGLAATQLWDLITWVL